MSAWQQVSWRGETRPAVEPEPDTAAQRWQIGDRWDACERQQTNSAEAGGALQNSFLAPLSTSPPFAHWSWSMYDLICIQEIYDAVIPNLSFLRVNYLTNVECRDKGGYPAENIRRRL